MADALAFVRAATRLTLIVVLTALFVPPVLALKGLRGRSPRWLIIWWYRLVRRICGMRVHVHGQPARHRPMLFVANHISHMDIIVLAAVLDAAFVAKADIAGWPVVGWISWLCDVVFVERRASQAGKQRLTLTERLQRGDRLILFAEGTSTDGTRVLPFKSALFAVARDGQDGAAIPVQPVTVAYRPNPADPPAHSVYAWYGDMTFAPHFWQVLRLPGGTVDLTFHPLLSLDTLGSRKALAARAHELVASALPAHKKGRRRAA